MSEIIISFAASLTPLYYKRVLYKQKDCQTCELKLDVVKYTIGTKIFTRRVKDFQPKMILMREMTKLWLSKPRTKCIIHVSRGTHPEMETELWLQGSSKVGERIREWTELLEQMIPKRQFYLYRWTVWQFQAAISRFQRSTSVCQKAANDKKSAVHMAIHDITCEGEHSGII